MGLFQTPLQLASGLAQVVFPTSRVLPSDGRVRGCVGEPAAILVLVSVLTSSSGTREPLDFQVLLTELWPSLPVSEDCDSDSAGVYSSTTLCGWYSLEAMAACFLQELLAAGAGHLEGETVPTGLSAIAGSELLVGLDQVHGKEF